MPVPYHEAQAATTTHTPPPSSSPSKWGPYSGAGDFSTNMVIILVILFCALVLALAVNAVVRYLLCSFRRQPHSSDPEKCSDDRKAQTQAVESSPTLLFSAAAATKLAGAEAECAICLAEFADGDRVRLLPKCNHGFHVSCIEKWLVSRKSCPTCRASSNGLHESFCSVQFCLGSSPLRVIFAFQKTNKYEKCCDATDGKLWRMNLEPASIHTETAIDLIRTHFLNSFERQ